MELSIIKEKIFTIRGHKIMLDFDLAELYGVETRVLKQAVRRNIDRFPDDFMFELTKEELENWRSQFVMSNEANKMGLRYAPFAFTEQGVAMLSSVLKSKKAIQVNISIIRAFVMYRKHLSDYGNLKEQIAKLEKEMNLKFKDIHQALNYLLQKDKIQVDQQSRKQIGFKKGGNP
ncbi:MAG: ORF6N domain-containing protein, partial [Candidatus Omnitrophica bacterium]|nr:ORF6N domain-containing protein [Candidatus Omnitrophota bacterium]